MLKFEDVYEFTSTIGSHTSFEKEECSAYFTVLTELSQDEQIVEVGLEYGRSSSVALQVAKDRGLRYVAIELMPRKEWFDQLGALYHSVRPLPGGFFGFDSSKVPVTEPISLILIDGDHSYAGVKADCEHFLPHVRQHGFALFHDYERESLPDVTVAVNEYMDIHGGWRLTAVVGTLAIWRKL